MSKNETILHFEKEDFYTEKQKAAFFDYYNQVEDKEQFVKEAVIYRALIEGQSSRDSYEKIVQLLLFKGVEQFLNGWSATPTAPTLSESDVERIVNRILEERGITKQVILQSIAALREQVKQASEQPVRANGERRKPSERLKLI